MISSTALIVLTSLLAHPQAEDAKKIEFFEKKIRPVLVEQCYSCHSVQAEQNGKLKGKLRLDDRAAILRGGDSGPALVPGKPGDSLLLKALHYEGDLKMPPKGKLSARVIEDFNKWIQDGALDPRKVKANPEAVSEETIDIEQGRKFWSFQALKKSEVPSVKNKSWVKTEVDHFILNKLEESGISPASTADRRILIRRLYFGLIGLPPSKEQVEAFEKDTSPKAYENLVDQLLKSPHFGERWARHWLDLARFAESNGYAFDRDRPFAYHYRDFVIRALNQDLPYDEFIRLQIAGDHIKPGDFMSTAATGFLVAGPFTTQQTQKERERSRYEQLDDMIATLGNATLGLTLGCARCHDHKFDPVPSKDYYELISTFAELGFSDVGIDLDPEAYTKAKAEFDKKHQPFVAKRTQYEKEKLPSKFLEWEKNRPKDPPRPTIDTWYHLGPLQAGNFDEAFSKKFPPEEKVSIKEKIGNLKWTARPNWKDGAIHNTLTGDNSANYLYRKIVAPEAVSLEVSLGRDDAIKAWLNGKEVLSKKVTGGVAADQDKITLALKPGENAFLLKIVNASGPSGFYFKAKKGGPPDQIVNLLKVAVDKRTPKQVADLLAWYKNLDPGWQELQQLVVESEKKAPKQTLTKVYSARNGGTTYNFGANTRKVYHLIRGNSNSKLKPAQPGFLQVLTSVSSDKSRWTQASGNSTPDKKLPPRVAMARWLTDSEQGAGHLLARVIVNRLWQHHIGRGIVSTPNDFGTQGERPSHPELLDYLAQKLIDSGWKLKSIHRLILTSQVYMQQNSSDKSNYQKDPENRLFWRRESKRLDAEIIRDALLATSGKLDRTLFGKGSLDVRNLRRSIYLTIKRSRLIPTLQLFDAPDAMQSIGERSTTTVAPQALAMMNSSFVRDLAMNFAKSLTTDPKVKLETLIDAAYWKALSRSPTDKEVQRMRLLIEHQEKSYGGTPQAREKALVDFCQLLMCLNEFVYID